MSEKTFTSEQIMTSLTNYFSDKKAHLFSKTEVLGIVAEIVYGKEDFETKRKRIIDAQEIKPMVDYFKGEQTNDNPLGCVGIEKAYERTISELKEKHRQSEPKPYKLADEPIEKKPEWYKNAEQVLSFFKNHKFQSG